MHIYLTSSLFQFFLKIILQFYLHFKNYCYNFAASNYTTFINLIKTNRHEPINL